MAIWRISEENFNPSLTVWINFNVIELSKNDACQVVEMFCKMLAHFKIIHLKYRPASEKKNENRMEWVYLSNHQIRSPIRRRAYIHIYIYCPTTFMQISLKFGILYVINGKTKTKSTQFHIRFVEIERNFNWKIICKAYFQLNASPSSTSFTLTDKMELATASKIES